MRKIIALSMLSVLMLGVATWAQNGPPKILQITREDVKAGKGPAHNAYEARWTQAATKVDPTPYIGMTSMNSTEAWWISGYDSFASLEKAGGNSALNRVMDSFAPGDSEYINSNRTMTLRFREDLSYGADQPLGDAHGFVIRTVRLRVGHDQDFEQVRKLVKEAVARTDAKPRSVVYQVVAGAPNGTFLVFTPFKSLAERDNTAMGDAIGQALGDEGRAKIAELQNRGYNSTDDQIFMFNPSFSNPSADMRAAAPDFWKPKATMAKAAAPTGAKPATSAAKAPEKEKAKAGK